MKLITKLKLMSVKLHCEAEEKSTEYMLQLMQDTCNVKLENCVDFLANDLVETEKNFDELLKVIVQLEELIV